MRMLFGAASVVVLGFALLLGAGKAPVTAPELPSQDRAQWVGEPVSLQQLRGRVVLLDIWTFG